MSFLESSILWTIDRGADVFEFFGPLALPALGAFLLLLFVFRAVPNNWQSRAIGYALVLVGFACGAGSLVGICLMALPATFGGNSDALPMLLLLASSPFCIMFGWMLAAGRKTLLLFLRRFGNEELNDAIRELVRSRCRTRVRLITLDDSVFSPVGPRWGGLLLSLMPTAVLLGLTVLVFPAAAREVSGEGMFGGAAAFILFIIIGVTYLGCAIWFALGVAAARSRFAARKVISNTTSLKRVLARLRSLASLWRAPGILAPVATVVSVSDSLWQTAVEAIGKACDVALLDVTHSRPHICWELRTLLQQNTRIVLLAQRDGLAKWREPSNWVEDTHTTLELRELIIGLPLLIYDTPHFTDDPALIRAITAE